MQLESFDFNLLRILDFFFLFPHQATNISFPRVKGVSEVKKLASHFNEPYERLPDTKRLFSELSDFHIQAIQILNAKKILKIEGEKISLAENFYSPSIQHLLEDNLYVTNVFFSKLTFILKNIKLSGENGLKRRSGLMEYRYDAA